MVDFLDGSYCLSLLAGSPGQNRIRVLNLAFEVRNEAVTHLGKTLAEWVDRHESFLVIERV